MGVLERERRVGICRMTERVSVREGEREGGRKKDFGLYMRVFVIWY